LAKVRSVDSFRDGHEDRLEPLEPIDLGKLRTVDDVVRAMGGCSFGARSLGEAADVLEEMFRDGSCYTVLTISGAMTVAKMQLIFIELLEREWVDAVVATGALVAHGFIEGTGMTHFKHRRGLDDKKLYELGYDRVYDTLELEKNLHEASLLIDRIFQQEEYNEKSFTSPEICRILGDHLLRENIGGASILKSAARRDIPIYIPALNDSELGLDLLSLRYLGRPHRKNFPVHLEHSALSDVSDFASRVAPQKRLGIFTIGGGVPRNWAQQIAPFLELRYEVQDRGDMEFPRYFYGVRVCPEPVHWGGLSGCTYSEGISWGKFREDGRFAEVYADATIVLPFLVKALMERFDS
jgi:deoxyhypusine synthase